MTPSLYITPIAGLAGLALAFVFYRAIAKRSGGEGKIAEIAEKIHRGSMVFMKREFILISIFSLVIGACLFFFQKGRIRPPAKSRLSSWEPLPLLSPAMWE